jgi:hypothetical protein
MLSAVTSSGSRTQSDVADLNAIYTDLAWFRIRNGLESVSVVVTGRPGTAVSGTGHDGYSSFGSFGSGPSTVLSVRRLWAWDNGCGGTWYLNPSWPGFTFLPGLFDATVPTGTGRHHTPPPRCPGAFSGYGWRYPVFGSYHRPRGLSAQ